MNALVLVFVRLVGGRRETRKDGWTLVAEGARNPNLARGGLGPGCRERAKRVRRVETRLVSSVAATTPLTLLRYPPHHLYAAYTYSSL